MATAGFTVPPTKQFDLGNGSDLLYFENFLERKEASGYLESLNNELPWIRPTLSVYGRKCEQPRETCYVADEGLPTYKYSGYQPIVYKWEDFPVLKIIANAVHSALPAAKFNSVLLNRYTNGNDYAAWHADDEKVYGSTPTIASITLGAEREFLIRKKGSRTQNLCCTPVVHDTGSQSAFDVLKANSARQSQSAKRKSTVGSIREGVWEKPSRELYTFVLKHGSLFVMQGYTQRDWEHSVPKRKRVNGLRINLTFRYITSEQR